MVRKFQFLFIFKTFFWEHFKKTRFGFILPDGFNLKLLFLLEPKKITFFCVNVENGTTAFCSHIQQRFPSCIFGVNDNVLLRLFRYLYKRFQRAYIKMKVCMCVCVCACVCVRRPAAGPTQAITPKFGVGSSFHPGSAPS
jgi:hypothetical protein